MQLLVPLVALLLIVPLAVVFVMYIVIPLFKGIGWFVRQIFRFVGGEVTDSLRVVGSIITCIVFVPLVIGNIIIGRWSAMAHFGRAIQGELATAGVALYRMVVGHPARLFCLTALTDGIEQRLPEVVAATPGADKPSKRRVGQFDGYTIIGSLAGGGSGARLFVAEPDEVRRAAFTRAGQEDIGQVVIKSFSLHDGSSLPQIIRESRSLDAAKKLGLVLDHNLGDERFYYVMRFVPGESLGLVTQRLHAMSGSAGLNDEGFRRILRFESDLLSTLDMYHRGGLWHKDVKPDNIIVDKDQAQLVDFGLITPLRSAMTLTTHGTEYFRDPEMVRMALRGAKVHQVDGAKFDIYAAGAVLYSVIENSFPAHGGLSQISKRCPETLRWVIRRAMTDYDKRYATVAEMMADLEVVAQAVDPFSVKPIDLPSMKNGGVRLPTPPPVEEFGPVAGAATAQAAAFAGAADGDAVAYGKVESVPDAGGRARAAPRIRLASWWSGKYTVEDEGLSSLGGSAKPSSPVEAVEARHTPRPASAPRGHRAGLSAREQVEAARSRAKAARVRAKDRVRQRAGGRGGAGKFDSNINVGAGTAVAAFLGLAFLGVAATIFLALGEGRGHDLHSNGEIPGVGSISIPDFPENLSSDLQAAIDDGLERVARIDEQLAAVGVAAPAMSLDPMDGTVLLVQDLNPPITDAARDRIQSVVERLNSAGLNVVGSAQTVDIAQGDLEHHRDLVAQAKYTKSMTPLGTSRLAADLGAWLSEDQEADVVVWVSTFKNDDAENPDFWIVPRPVDGEDPGDGAYMVKLLGIVAGSIG